MKVWKCAKCGWAGKKPATLGAAGIKVKVCQICLSGGIKQEEA